jgi:hypothetical protein
MKKKVTNSFNRREELSDEETARALGMNYATYRSQSSRCCKEVQRLMTEMKKEDFAKLDANSLLLVDRICNIDENTLDSIVDSLVTGAERQLPQYSDLLEARLRKEHGPVFQSIVLPESSLDMDFDILEKRKASVSSEAESASSRTDASSGSSLGRIFEKLKPSKKVSRASAERPQLRKKTFVETFVDNFKSFLSV